MARQLDCVMNENTRLYGFIGLYPEFRLKCKMQIKVLTIVTVGLRVRGGGGNIQNTNWRYGVFCRERNQIPVVGIMLRFNNYLGK